MKSFQTRISRRTMLGRWAQAMAFAAATSPFAPLLAAPRSRWFKIGACDWSLGKRATRPPSTWPGRSGWTACRSPWAPRPRHARFAGPRCSRQLSRGSHAAIRPGDGLGGHRRNVATSAEKRSAGGTTGFPTPSTCAKPWGLPSAWPPALQRRSRLEQDGRLRSPGGRAERHRPKAEKQGIRIGLESYLSAEDNLRLLDRVGSPALKVYYDVGNSTDKGRDISREIRPLGKRSASSTPRTTAICWGKAGSTSPGSPAWTTSSTAAGSNRGRHAARPDSRLHGGSQVHEGDIPRHGLTAIESSQ